MKPIVFIDQEEEGDEDLYQLQLLPEKLFFSVSFGDEYKLTIRFYKERSGFDTNAHFCEFRMSFDVFKEFKIDLMLDGLSYAYCLTIYDLAAQLTMEYMTYCILNDLPLYANKIYSHIFRGFDKYIRKSVEIFSKIK